MPSVLVFLAGIFVSLLPPRYRRWWPLEDAETFRWAATLSGLMQGTAAVFMLIFRYLDRSRGSAIGAALLGSEQDIEIPTAALGS